MRGYKVCLPTKYATKRLHRVINSCGNKLLQQHLGRSLTGCVKLTDENGRVVSLTFPRLAGANKTRCKPRRVDQRPTPVQLPSLPWSSALSIERCCAFALFLPLHPMGIVRAPTKYRRLPGETDLGDDIELTQQK